MKQNLKKSKQRDTILNTLCQLKTHPTAEELYDLVKERIPRLSLATVYRNLELLSEMGYVQKLDTGGRQKRFDGNPSNHPHIVCVICGKVADIEMQNDPVFFDAIIDKKGYDIIAQKIEFQGICPKCKGVSLSTTIPYVIQNN
jgi:Fur family ferric uptake transcriptional regulator